MSISNALQFLAEAAKALDQAESEMVDAGCVNLTSTADQCSFADIFEHHDGTFAVTDSIRLTVAEIEKAIVALHAELSHV